MLTKSAKLRKYGYVYKSYLKKTTKNIKGQRKKPSKSPINERVKVIVKEKSTKKLTKYQKFVKKESEKSKYKNMPPKVRFQKIAQAWRLKYCQ